MNNHIDKAGEIYNKLIHYGWAKTDFYNNELSFIYDLNIGSDDEASILFNKYWNTVILLNRNLVEHGIKPIFLKSRRNYYFADSNVDILISKEDWDQTIQILHKSDWRIPSQAVQIKQNLIEHSKLKLPARKESLLPAHLYGAVSWRYQSDVGFLPQDDSQQEYLENVSVESLCPEGYNIEDEEILMTTLPADLLIHAAQTIFENYRIKFGEVYFMNYLWDNISDAELKQIEHLAKQYGGYEAMVEVNTVVERNFNNEENWSPEKWPLTLNHKNLWKIWYKRAKNVRKRVSWIRAYEEMLGYGLFSSMYLVKRRIFD